jgi:16S rRNA (guanine(966)-N(2))-methyltransferase RsmD
MVFALMLKIIAGEYRSRVLASPEDARTSRPYSGRVKESVFNLLRGWFEEGATALDLFAGVGTMGLEAISRGASRVTLIERDRAIVRLLEQNIAALGCEDRATVVAADALSPAALLKAPSPVDVIFVDPPYELMQQPKSRKRVLEQVARCRSIMGEKGFIVLRSPVSSSEVDLHVEGFDGPEEHLYGHEMHVMLYAPKQA